MITSVLDTKIGQAENKTPVAGNLITTCVLDNTCKILAVMTLKYQTLKKILLVLLIKIDLLVIYLIQK